MNFNVKFSLFVAFAAAVSPVFGASVVVPLDAHGHPETIALEQPDSPAPSLGTTNLASAQPSLVAAEIRAIDGSLPEELVASLPPSAFWADSNDIYTVSRSTSPAITRPAEFAPKAYAGLKDVFAPLPMDPTNLLQVSEQATRPIRTAALDVTSQTAVSASARGATGARHGWFTGGDLKLSGALFVHEPAAVDPANRRIASLAGGL